MKYIVVIFSLITFIACNKEETNVNQPLMGTYKYVSLHVPPCDGRNEIRFTYNGSEECTENDSGGIKHCRKGQLTITPNQRFVSTIEVHQGILDVFAINGQGTVTVSNNIVTFCYDNANCFDTQLSQGRIIATTKNTWGCDVNHYLSK